MPQQSPSPTQPPLAALAFEATDERQMARDLRKALADDALALHFQKRVALGTRAVIAAEALLRWQDRRRGIIPPATFLPLIDRTGMGPSMDSWVLVSACRAASSWPGKGTIVAVNVAARQLHEAILLRQVAAALQETGLPPSQLELELPETALLDAEPDTILALAALRDLGIGIALDNFGAVHGSLSLLKRLPLSSVKLDRSLTHGLPDRREDVAVVAAAVKAAHGLELTVVAEGVETEAQLALLSAIGCNHGQGYLFGLPAPQDRLLPDLPPG